MANKDIYTPVYKIEDERLAAYEKRTRSGSTQVFYTGSDSRDFERYRAEGGNCGHSVEMHDKPDTIRLQPPERHYYAELIDGEWWWVNGCSKCNNDNRDWAGYIVCEKHDICVTCETPRSQIKETPWGHRKGWQCRPCHSAEHEADKKAALDAMPEEHDDWDFHGRDEITCPYCAYEFSDSWEHSADDNEDHECPRCDNVFKVTAIPSLTFDCSRIGAQPEAK